MRIQFWTSVDRPLIIALLLLIAPHLRMTFEDTVGIFLCVYSLGIDVADSVHSL